MEIKIKRLHNDVKIPTKAHPSDAGFDLYACLDKEIYIQPNQTIMIPTGFAWEIPEGYFGGIYARSGLATKENLRPANCVGVVDSSYRGEVIVALHNDGISYIRQISPNEKIAQMVIHSCVECNLTEVEELSFTERGNGGFGSTGK